MQSSPTQSSSLTTNGSRNSYCRLCLRRNGTLGNIYSENDDPEESNSIANYISLFFDIKVAKTDPYSTAICEECCAIIGTTCKHKMNFKKNNALLRREKTSNQNQVKLKVKVTPRCHESVKKIFAKYKNIKIAHELWGIDLNPKVNVKKLQLPKGILKNSTMKKKKRTYVFDSSDSQTPDPEETVNNTGDNSGNSPISFNILD